MKMELVFTPDTEEEKAEMGALQVKVDLSAELLAQLARKYLAATEPR
jgi:hypothetical protein